MNKARELLTKHIDRLIADGQPVIAEIPTHHAFMLRNPPPRPCCAHDMNFGGECFNCGYNPKRTA